MKQLDFFQQQTAAQKRSYHSPVLHTHEDDMVIIVDGLRVLPYYHHGRPLPSWQQRTCKTCGAQMQLTLANTPVYIWWCAKCEPWWKQKINQLTNIRGKTYGA